MKNCKQICCGNRLIAGVRPIANVNNPYNTKFHFEIYLDSSKSFEENLEYVKKMLEELLLND